MSDTNEAKSNDVKPHTWTDGGESVLILRRINPDGTSTNAFRWPDGINVDVEAPNWEATPKCGNGLHGWPWGMGLGEGCDCDIITDRWLVIAVKPEDIVGELDGGWKCKFRFGTKLYDGVFAGAWAMVNSGRHRLMVKMAASGNSSTQAASGNSSTQAASGNSSKQAASGNSSKQAASGNSSKQAASGNYSKQAASGDSSTQAASGNSSTQAASGNYSKQAASGKYSTQAASGNYSKQAASGNSSKQAASGDSSTQAASGNYSTQAASGYYSKQAASGNYACCVQAADGGEVAVGSGGAFCLRWTDKDGRPRFAIGYEGEDGIKANTWYCVRDGRLVEVSE